MNSPNRSTLRAWFAFGLRLLAFWQILEAGYSFITALNISMGFTKTMGGQYSFGSYMTHTLGHLILAFWLLATAPKIARLVYPDPAPQDDDSTKAPLSDKPTI